ncbi:MAG: hypothetical protein J0M24_03230 [Verrucomicrobia bacterium]|nr:hypothetical protein [Verrucomicrobiota bacterium]
MGKTIEISRYRNGQVRERIPLQDCARHGRVQSWHRNGVLASEEFYVNGRLHGIGRQWDETGKLLGEFTVDQGTGVQREWHDNGRIKVEVCLVAGKFCGPSRIWLRDGTLLSERFFLQDRPVSRAQYSRAVAKNPTLPPPGASVTKPRPSSRATERRVHQVFVEGLLEKLGAVEARSWLSGVAKSRPSRSLGRFRSGKAALELVTALYEAGAFEVTVPGIYRDRKGKEYADWLLVRLPRLKAVRGRIRKACRILKQKELGALLPETDLGETHLVLALE